MKYELPKLNYSYDALEPYIDEATMTIHHTKHHQAYINNLNSALGDYPDLQDLSLADLLKNLDKVPEKIYWAVRNNGGGHFNHSLFWEILGKGNWTGPKGELLDKLTAAYGSFEAFKDAFSKAALSHFGSGWAWLVVDRENNLKIVTTANQDNPISDGFKPVLCLDIWEHAYYLKYNNRRIEYINAWWNVVNWTAVEDKFSKSNLIDKK